MQFQLASSQCCLDACTIGCHRTMYWVHVHVHTGPWCMEGSVPLQRAEQRPLRKKCAPPPSLGIRIGYQDTKYSSWLHHLSVSICVHCKIQQPCPLSSPSSSFHLISIPSSLDPAIHKFLTLVQTRPVTPSLGLLCLAICWAGLH